MGTKTQALQFKPALRPLRAQGPRKQITSILCEQATNPLTDKPYTPLSTTHHNSNLFATQVLQENPHQYNIAERWMFCSNPNQSNPQQQTLLNN